MKIVKKYVPVSIVYLFEIYLTGIIIFTVARFLLLILNWRQAAGIPFLTLLESFVMGWRFDTVISGYILALPALILGLAEIIGWRHRLLFKIFHVYFFLFYTIAFFLVGADIPYFKYFNFHLNVTLLHWTNTPGFMVNIVLQDPQYYPFILGFVIVVIIFYRILKTIQKRTLQLRETRQPVGARILISLLAFLLIFLGIRGRISPKSPIRWGTAFFSDYPFANQLGLNPIFTLGQSIIDSKNPKQKVLRLMDNQKAIRLAQRYLGISPQDTLYSPIARKEKPAEPFRPVNVILVLLESMSARKMGYFGNPDSLTPFLDSLAQNSYSFRRIYSAGIHTYNGIFASLFGFPALLTRHPMKGVESMQPFRGISRILKEKGYQTIYVCTHDAQFDNMAGFLRANGFDYIVSQEDYPKDKILSTLGVPDHVMFEESLPYLDRLAKNGRPFFATYLTASDHGPYIIPPDIPFKPRSQGIKKQIVEYVDWSVRHFLNLARQKPWFKNTLFVFTGDHGALMNPIYDIDLAYHHIPFFIYSPNGTISPKEFSQLGGQIDIFPTILGLLNVDYINNTMGINLLRQTRPFAYFSDDETIGVLSDSLLLIIRPGNNMSLYKYKTGELTDYINRYPEIAEQMKTYVYAMLQTTQWMIRNRKVY